MNATTPNHEFPLQEARDLVRDLMVPNPWVYWPDFLFHTTLGWAAFLVALGAPTLSGAQATATIVAVLALYRAAIFIHELAHLKKGSFRAFRFVWNAICGVPLQIPSFTYDGVHNDHHKRDVYGTHEDGEYIAFGVGSPAALVRYVFLSMVLPLLFLGRFLILAPLSYVFPPLRSFAWARASSLTIDLSYARPENAIRNDENWRVQEVAAFLFAAAVALGVALDFLPVTLIVLWYVVAVMIFFLNSIRTLAAHAYRNPGERSLSVAEQYLDSINVPGNIFLTALWAPVGLRYHATHHLFPNLPYHNLGKAHRRLAHNFSQKALYLETRRDSLFDALKRIWTEAATASRARAR
jgi:fatty acid desaturase